MSDTLIVQLGFSIIFVPALVITVYEGYKDFKGRSNGT